MRIAIVGTGISALSVAHLLKDNHEIVLFEKQEKPGGLIKCDRVQDCLFHKVGGHVFNSRNQKVLDWFWSHFQKDTEFVSARRNAKIFFKGKIIGYPIENYIYLLEPALVKQIISELLVLQQLPKKHALSYDNFEQFLQGNFGETLYQLYFKPYNEKIWQTDLSTVSMDWLEGKLPMPDLLEMLQSNIVRQEEDNMVHASFFYPKDGGSQFIVDRLKHGLTIHTGTEITELEEKDNKLLVTNQLFDKLIYCGDVRHFPSYGKELMKQAGVDIHYLETLRSNGTSNLFCETDDTDISWMYLPENFTSAHRIIYTGNFSPTNNRGSNRKTCVVEFSGKVDFEVMIQEIQKLPGHLVPLAYNYEPNSYVVQDSQTRVQINMAKAALDRHNMYLLGRFAEWEYYNMDKAIEAAMALSKKIDTDFAGNAVS